MPIHFEIHRSGRTFSAAADGNPAFFIGIQTQYTDHSSGQSFDGLFNVPTSQLPKLLYQADAFRPALQFWADFIEPTTECEGQNFLTLNTYDRARFTWGFGQFGAHVADGDFVRFFRAMLGQPESADYFPDLKIVDGRICKIQNGSTVQLENATTTGPLLDYLNPSSQQVEDPEVIAAARLIHWTTNHDSAQGLQVAQMVATFKGLMTESDTRLGLDGRTADICCVICDIRHQGRAKYPVMQAALRSQNPLEALLEIGATTYKDRIKTLRAALAARAALFGSRKWNRSKSDFV